MLISHSPRRREIVLYCFLFNKVFNICILDGGLHSTEHDFFVIQIRNAPSDWPVATISGFLWLILLLIHLSLVIISPEI